MRSLLILFALTVLPIFELVSQTIDWSILVGIVEEQDRLIKVEDEGWSTSWAESANSFSYKESAEVSFVHNSSSSYVVGLGTRKAEPTSGDYRSIEYAVFINGTEGRAYGIDNGRVVFQVENVRLGSSITVRRDQEVVEYLLNGRPIWKGRSSEIKGELLFAQLNIYNAKGSVSFKPTDSTPGVAYYIDLVDFLSTDCVLDYQGAAYPVNNGEVYKLLVDEISTESTFVISSLSGELSLKILVDAQGAISGANYLDGIVEEPLNEGLYSISKDGYVITFRSPKLPTSDSNDIETSLLYGVFHPSIDQIGFTIEGLEGDDFNLRIFSDRNLQNEVWSASGANAESWDGKVNGSIIPGLYFFSVSDSKSTSIGQLLVYE